MLKKTISYEDFDGNPVTETFYFNLTKAELVELEVGAGQEGLANKLQAIVESNDGQEIIDNFKRIILLAYGKKSPDGKRFMKSPEIAAEFAATNAYSELFMELATNAEEAAAFMRGIIPAGLAENSNQLVLPTEEVKVEVEVKTESATPDISSMSREELLHEIARQRGTLPAE